MIGRRGRTAQSIRTVVRAAATRDDTEVDIEFLDECRDRPAGGAAGDRPAGLLEIGHIRRAHGVRGEVSVELARTGPNASRRALAGSPATAG